MFRVREYAKTYERTADMVPWFGLIHPAVMLNKTGEFFACFRFHGPDLEAMGDYERMTLSARCNAVVKMIPEGWALQTEVVRRPSSSYPDSAFPSRIAQLVDAERQALFGDASSHLESDYYLTLTYRTPTDSGLRAGSLLWEGLSRSERSYEGELRYFLDALDTFSRQFAGMVWIEQLEGESLLSYLHMTATLDEQRVAVPDVPVYLDLGLCTKDLTPGIRPRLGHTGPYLRTLSVGLLPKAMHPAILAALDTLGFPYRWCQRWIASSRQNMDKMSQTYRRNYLKKRKGLRAMLGEKLSGEPSRMVNETADVNAEEAGGMSLLVNAGDVAGGFYTGVFLTWDATEDGADAKLKQAAEVFHSIGATLYVENLNLVESWLGTLPGHIYANVRKPPIHSMNLAHLFPWYSTWAGPEWNTHLDGPPLLYASSMDRTPYRLSLHQGDVAHAMIIGPTGAGKSLLINMIALQWPRYAGAQTFIFEMGRSARVSTELMGGQWYALGSEGGLVLQPLALVDETEERSWAVEWVDLLARESNILLRPNQRTEIWDALTALAAMDKPLRTLSNFGELLQDTELRALVKYVVHVHGDILDGAEDELTSAPWQCFELEALATRPSILPATLLAIFRRLERWLVGQPTVFVIDEAWLAFKVPVLGERISTWLKTLRKRNGSVIFATQSLEEVGHSSIGGVLAQECLTRIFLPNSRAMEPRLTACYNAFGLSDTQIELLANATPKRHYYYDSPSGSRLFDLELGPVALACAGAGSPKDLRLLDDLLAQGVTDFPVAWLEAKGVGWATDVLRQSPDFQGSLLERV